MTATLDFDRLAKALHWGPDKRLLMLKAYFDDSGQSEQVVGGCLASEETWSIVDDKWAEALRDHGLTWFHAIDFEDGRHPDYSHLSLPEKEALFERLLILLGSHIGLPRKPGSGWGAYICGVARPATVDLLNEIDQIDYRTNRKGKSQRERSGFVSEVVSIEHDPYCMCLGLCFRRMLDECGVSRESPVHVLIASQAKKKWKIDRVYFMAASIERWSMLLAGLSNGPEMEPRQIRPLQAADFVAYYLGKSLRKPDDPRASRAAARLSPQFIGYAEKLAVTAGWL